MANNRRGKRGSGITKLSGGTGQDAKGFPAGAQGNKPSVAQSGGISNSFSDGKRGQGSAWQSPGGGNRSGMGGPAKSGGTFANGAHYNVRGPGVDRTTVRGVGNGRGGAPAAGSAGEHNGPRRPKSLGPKGGGGAR